MRHRTPMQSASPVQTRAATITLPAGVTRGIGNQAVLRRSGLLGATTLRRACACGSGVNEDRATVHRAAESAATAPATVPPIVNAVLRTGGAPLDASVRKQIQPLFGQDLGMVRVHADEQAAASARAVDARAYAVGRHIVFGTEQYAPNTDQGSQLLLHELAHVGRSGAADYREGMALELGRQDDPAEHEAEQVASTLRNSLAGEDSGAR